MASLRDSLRYGERGGKVDEEVPPDVPLGNEVGVDDQVPAAEHPGAGGDIGGSELDDDVAHVEEVGNGAADGDEDGDVGLDLHAEGAPDVELVEVEGVDEEGHEAGEEEDAVP